MLRSATALLLAACLWAPALASAHGDAALQAAIHGPQRSTAHTARDAYRHPLQTLEFFGIRPDMTVVELWPGGGWYTEILAPYLRDHGQLIEAGYAPDSTSAYYRKGAASFAKKLADDPAVYGKVRMTYLDPGRPIEFANPGTADMVLTFRNLHNWMHADMLDDVFAAAFRALKPGGVFGVVEHRADAGADPHESDLKGYMPVQFVIARAQAAGFKLAAQSEINANPKDTKNYPKGVWTLPPTYTLGETDRARYAAIGESDRMTLKFVKPAKD